MAHAQFSDGGRQLFAEKVDAPFGGLLRAEDSRRVEGRLIAAAECAKAFARLSALPDRMGPILGTVACRALMREEAIQPSTSECR